MYSRPSRSTSRQPCARSISSGGSAAYSCIGVNGCQTCSRSQRSSSSRVGLIASPLCVPVNRAHGRRPVDGTPPVGLSNTERLRQTPCCNSAPALYTLRKAESGTARCRNGGTNGRPTRAATGRRPAHPVRVLSSPSPSANLVGGPGRVTPVGFERHTRLPGDEEPLPTLLF